MGTVKYGINHVTALVENKKAKFVVILPALCRKMDVPYCIIKSKSRLGTVVNKKTATALCLTDVRPGDQSALGKLRETVMNNFNNRFDNINRKWGGGIMGMKTVHKVANFEKQKAKELAARQG